MMIIKNKERKNHIIVFSFLILFQLVIIFPLLSWAGLPLIDDGFQLSSSRRILNGEFPHRDFISIRPVLTPIIHTIDLLISENYTFRLSRSIVYIQDVLIIFLSYLIYRKNCNTFLLKENLLLCLTGLFFLMDYSIAGTVSYTRDAVLLSLAGLYLVQSENIYISYAGFFLAGLAPLAKQSFGLFPLSLIILSKPKKQLYSFISLCAGPFIYLCFLLYFHALNDFILQIRSQSQISYILRTGCSPAGAVLFLLAGIGLAFIARKCNNNTFFVKLILVAGALFCATVPLIWGQSNASKSWFIFYFIIGWFIYSRPVNYNLSWPVIIVPMVLAWSSSLSFFHTTMSFLGLWLFSLATYIIFSHIRSSSDLRLYFILISFIMTAADYIYIRTNLNALTFTEPGIIAIKYPLDNIVPGANGIYTSEKNYRMYVEIRDSIEILKSAGLKPIILPDVTFWNVMRDTKNPVAIDWPFFMELANDELRNRFEKSVVELKDTHGLIFHTDPIIDEKRFGKYSAIEYNAMWRRIMSQYPVKQTNGRVTIYTNKTIKSF